MHIRAVAAAALLLVPVIAAAPAPRAPAVPAAVGGGTPYRLTLSRDAPTPAAGGTVTVTLTVDRPQADGTAAVPVDPALPLSVAEEGVGVDLTGTGGATVVPGALTGCTDVAEGVCLLRGEPGLVSTVTFSVDVAAGSADAEVQAAITEHRDADEAEFSPAVDVGPTETAVLSVGPGFAVTYSPEVVAPGGVVRVVVSGLPTDGDYRLSWSQGVAPVGPFRAVGGVIDASFPILQFDPLGPRTLLVAGGTDGAAAPTPTTARAPLLVVPGSSGGG
ncbi:hypothetical protein [uncultured Amnibacterium sp.]|uniref:hypothetical protein n=1 Tax=uncultured Amnibacterium sp. TaxID=1631851 RepID=UPI0035CA0EB7